MTNVPKLFCTDGIRAQHNQWPLDEQTVKKIGFALCSLTCAKTVVVCRDGRYSGESILYNLSSGIRKHNAIVLDGGILPTSAVSILVKELKADAGVSISASHNPPEYNGIKIFDANGIKLSSKYERQIERFLVEDNTTITGGADIKDIKQQCMSIYNKFLDKTCDYDFKNIKVVVDCANGAASYIAEKFLKSKSVNPIMYSNTPDGTNINKDCGSMHPKNIIDKTVSTEAELGVAFDGDADRAIFCNSEGGIVDGDFVLAMVGIDMLRQGTLSGNTVVGTVMSNLGLEVALSEKGGRLIRTSVGDKNVLDAMLMGNYCIGGEQSGHIIFLKHSTTGDGIVTLLEVLNLLNKTGRSLKELASCMKKFPQVLLNANIKQKIPLEEINGYEKLIREGKKKLGKRGRIVVRYSGTEPTLRVMVEAESDSVVRTVAQDILNALTEKLQVK
jgi:phosphoglucosamine mutase